MNRFVAVLSIAFAIQSGVLFTLPQRHRSQQNQPQANFGRSMPQTFARLMANCLEFPLNNQLPGRSSRTQI
jgi:hypothetical protein